LLLLIPLWRGVIQGSLVAAAGEYDDNEEKANGVAHGDTDSLC